MNSEVVTMTGDESDESNEGPRGPFGDEGPRGPSEEGDQEGGVAPPLASAALDEDGEEHPVPLVISKERRAALRNRLIYFAKKGLNVVASNVSHEGLVTVSVGLVVVVNPDFFVILRQGTEGRSSKHSLSSLRDVRVVGEATR